MLIQSTNVDQKSLETDFSIVICRPTGDNRKHCSDFDPRSSIVKRVFCCRQPGMCLNHIDCRLEFRYSTAHVCGYHVLIGIMYHNFTDWWVLGIVWNYATKLRRLVGSRIVWNYATKFRRLVGSRIVWNYATKFRRLVGYRIVGIMPQNFAGWWGLVSFGIMPQNFAGWWGLVSLGMMPQNFAGWWGLVSFEIMSWNFTGWCII